MIWLLIAVVLWYLGAVDAQVPGTELSVFPNASNPAASNYQFQAVTEVAMDSVGNIYVADYATSDSGGIGRVVVLSSLGELLYAFPNASDPSASKYQFSFVNGVAVDSVGNIYVADYLTNNGRVVVLSSSGALLSAFPNTSDPSASNYQFNNPNGVAVDSVGNIYVADYATSDNGAIGRVVVLSSLGALLSVFPNASNPTTSNYQFTYVNGMAVDSVGNIYVADINAVHNGGLGRVVVLSSSGALLSAFPNASDPAVIKYHFENVAGVAVDSVGNVYVADINTGDNGGIGRIVVLAGLNGQSSPASLPSSSSSSSSSSSGSSSLSSSSSSLSSRVLGDPQFVGLRGQSYQIHGLDNSIYNLIIDNDLVVNAKFMFLSSGRCPTIIKPTNCWSHPGSYLGEIGFVHNASTLHLIGGAYNVGFASMTVVDEDITLDVLSPFNVSVEVGNFRLILDNSDYFINIVSLEVLDRHLLRTTHGLLGQTWRSPLSRGKDVAFVEGEIDDYVEQDDNILGRHFVYGV